LKTRYQELSDELKTSNNNYKIACIRHYDGINKWINGSLTSVGDPIILQDVSYNQAFDDCDIDGYQFYVVVEGDDSYFNNNKIHPKRNNLHDKVVNQSVFKKKK
jgi:hypothetical protein